LQSQLEVILKSQCRAGVLWRGPESQTQLSMIPKYFRTAVWGYELHPLPLEASGGHLNDDLAVAALKREMIAKLSLTLSIP